MSEPLVIKPRVSVDARRRLVDLPRGLKRVLLVASDAALLSIALWLSLSLRLSTFYWPKSLEHGARSSHRHPHSASTATSPSKPLASRCSLTISITRAIAFILSYLRSPNA